MKWFYNGSGDVHKAQVHAEYDVLFFLGLYLCQVRTRYCNHKSQSVILFCYMSTRYGTESNRASSRAIIRYAHAYVLMVVLRLCLYR